MKYTIPALSCIVFLHLGNSELLCGIAVNTPLGVPVRGVGVGGAWGSSDITVC
jgi:hypothetical protein